jgi:hypothetical protein
MFTLDAYRANVFPDWGLDWNVIRASALDASFNVYNFSTHELEVLGPADMNEDMLCACVSLPMWFPPVEANGQIYIDAVFITDANLEEAIARGADEIWVIWTVSRRSEWRDGFVANYFQIIETSANGHFNRIVTRIEDNNAAIAAGGTGEFGRRIDLKMLAAEVPLHYLVNVDANRFLEAVNLGVIKAREWCQTQGINFTPRTDPLPARPPAPKISMQFTEDMKGFVTEGVSDYHVGYSRGRQAGTRAMVHLTIKIDDVDAFVADPRHEAVAEGFVDAPAFGGQRPVQHGVFNLFVDQMDPNTKAMYYRLWFTDDQGQARTLVGFKDIKDDPGADEWEDTTTLFTRILDGHVTEDQDGAATTLASGILKILLPDFLRQLTTFRAEGGNAIDRLHAQSRFGGLFLGSLWQVYGPRVIGT